MAGEARKEEEPQCNAGIAIWQIIITLVCAPRERQTLVWMLGEPKNPMLATREQTRLVPSAGCARCRAMSLDTTCWASMIMQLPKEGQLEVKKGKEERKGRRAEAEVRNSHLLSLDSRRPLHRLLDSISVATGPNVRQL